MRCCLPVEVSYTCVGNVVSWLGEEEGGDEKGGGGM